MGSNSQKTALSMCHFFFAGPGNHCNSRKKVQTKVPDVEKIKTDLTVQEFLGFVNGKVFKSGFPDEATLAGHPVVSISQDPKKISFKVFFLLSKPHRHYGDIMVGK